jgi:predicted O-methyltransferase YrrM
MAVVTGKSVVQPGSFLAVWEEVSEIPGWLSKREADLLYAAAKRTPADGHIVEVGSFRGRSTTLLAHTGREVTAIDPLCLGTVDADGYTITEDDRAALAALVDRFDNLDWLRCEACDTRLYKPIDLLYIDGNHQGDAPLNDFRHFQPLLERGSYVVFHDFGVRRAVSRAVATLEREGTITQLECAGNLYVGQLTNRPPIQTRILLAHPSYGAVERESYDSEKHSVPHDGQIEVHILPPKSSLLAHGFNDAVVACNRRGGYDAFALIHADISCQAGWLAKMWQIMQDRELQVLHTVAPIKNSDGLTSTALAYSDDPWSLVRRLTMTELHKLPATFDINDIREHLDPNATALLPNTGCLLVRAGTWLEDFPGFAIMDRIQRNGEDWDSDVVPEDWNFGFWCARTGLSVGGTREVRLSHWGRSGFHNNDIWGMETDKHWLEKQ